MHKLYKLSSPTLTFNESYTEYVTIHTMLSIGDALINVRFHLKKKKKKEVLGLVQSVLDYSTNPRPRGPIWRQNNTLFHQIHP